MSSDLVGAPAIAFVARDGRVIEASPAFASALGADPSRSLATLADLSPDIGGALSRHVASALGGGALSAAELPPVLAAREPWRVHVTAVPRGAAAEAVAVVVLERASSSMSDEGARRQAEEALRASEDRFQQIAETISDVFFITDQRAFKLLYVNPAFERVYGRSRQEVYDDLTALMKCIHPDDRDRVLEAFAKSVGGPGHDVTYRIIRPDGAVAWVRDRGFSILASDGKTMMTSGLVSDVTEERKLRNDLLQAQKLESVGRLAGGLAHDFNNMLTIVLSGVDVAESMLPLASPVREELAVVREAGSRAAALTRQLLLFSRRQVVQPTVVDLSELVRGLQVSLARLVGDGITIAFELAPSDDAAVWADRGQVEQVFMNLAANARDAMPTGGKLTVRIAPIAVGDPGPPELGDVPPGDYVRLTFDDEGEAIPPAAREHIFEPFFAPRGRSSGIGLATTMGIVEKAGGHILVRGDAEKGATFEVLLPRAPRRRDALGGDAAPARAAAPSEKETILLVEDEAPVRRVAAIILRRSGYDVLEASDGVSALDVAGETAGRIDLLLTDVLMPRMGGVELADRMRVLRPGVRVLFTSGFTQDADLRLGEGAGYLEKPYVAATLLAKVRALLDSGAATAPSA